MSSFETEGATFFRASIMSWKKCVSKEKMNSCQKQTSVSQKQKAANRLVWQPKPHKFLRTSMLVGWLLISLLMARISAGVLPAMARRIDIMAASRQTLVMSAPL